MNYKSSFLRLNLFFCCWNEIAINHKFFFNYEKREKFSPFRHNFFPGWVTSSADVLALGFGVEEDEVSGEVVSSAVDTFVLGFMEDSAFRVVDWVDTVEVSRSTLALVSGTLVSSTTFVVFVLSILVEVAVESLRQSTSCL